MKRRKHFILCLVAVAVALMLLFIGYRIGVHRAIFESHIWTVDVFDPYATPADRWNGYDLRIFVNLDGQQYMTGLVQY